MMQGYLRPPEMVDELVEAVRAALYANPTQRMGQLICNMSGTRDLFNMHDEDMADLLLRSTAGG